MTITVKKKAEFQVNTGGITDNQRYSDVATLKNGNVIAVWTTQNTGNSATGGDGSGYSVKAKILNSSGNQVKSEFLVNTNTAGNQQIAKVVALSDGGFMVAWEDEGGQVGDTSGSSVRAQRYDSAGSKVGGEILVNHSIVNGDQDYVDVFEVGAGLVGFSWVSDSAADGKEVQLNIYSTSLNLFASERTVNFVGGGAGNQTGANSAVSTNGNVLVVWTTSANDDGSGGAIKYRLYDSSYNTLVGEALVNVNKKTGSQVNPQVEALADGRFVVAWTTQDATEDGDSTALLFRIYSKAGVPLTNEIRVNNKGTGGQDDVSIAALDDGRFLVVWESTDGTDPSLTGIKGRIFNKDGRAYGKEFLVNQKTSSYQQDAEVTTLKNGKVMVTWTTGSQADGDGNLESIKGRVLDVGSVWNGKKKAETIKGNNGRDEINGKDGADILRGLKGDDVIKGGKGKDKIYTGKGTDTATGNQGDDTFFFKKNEGKTTITDFENGKDKLNLKDFGYASKAAALNHFTDAGGANNDKVRFDHKGTEIIVKGIDLNQLNGADIVI